MRIHHIGVVVNNMDEALKLYHKMFGLTPVHAARSAPEHGLKMVSLPVGGSGEVFIEMIEPIGSESRFAKHLKERGEGLFHIAIFTEDWDEKVRELKEKGFVVEVQEAKAPGVSGTLKLGWLQPKDTRGVWFELINIDTPPL